MSEFRTTYLALMGLLGLAEKNGRSIPEEAIEQIRSIRSEDGLVSTSDIIGAAHSLHPGDTYVEGLKTIAETNKGLLRTAKKQIKFMGKNGQDEHIVPTKKALRYLTGREEL